MDKKIEYLLVKKKDDFCNTVEEFKNLLQTNTRVSINEDVLSIDKCKVKYNLFKQNIDKTKEVSFYLSFESLNKDDEDNDIKALENADGLLRRILEAYSIFYINTIWDDVSTYYGIKIYPKISAIENKLRKIIYFFMIRNMGSEWVERNIPNNVKESIKKTQEKNNIHNMLEDCLISADFIQLGHFFFIKYSRHNDLQALVMELNNIKHLDNHTIENIVEKYESKSNWDRYFANEINVDNLYDKWKNLYNIRNMVAHNKRIESEDYTLAIALISELEDAFDKCLERVNQVVVPEDEKDSIEEMAIHSIKRNLFNNVQYAASGIKNVLPLAGALSILAGSEAFKNYGALAGASSILAGSEAFKNYGALAEASSILAGSEAFKNYGALAEASSLKLEKVTNKDPFKSNKEKDKNME